MKPPFERSPAHVWLARDPAFSSFDPIAIALDSLCTADVHDRLPSIEELGSCGAVVVTTPPTPQATLDLTALTRIAEDRGVNVLRLTSGQSAGVDHHVRRLSYPLAVTELSTFVQTATGTSAAAV